MGRRTHPSLEFWLNPNKKQLTERAKPHCQVDLQNEFPTLSLAVPTLVVHLTERVVSKALGMLEKSSGSALTVPPALGLSRAPTAAGAEHTKGPWA